MSVVKEIVRFICGLIDGIAYDVISAIYNVFYELVNIIMYDREAFDALGKRIGLILGIIMLFRLAISLISYIINPDKMKDNNQGVKKIITNVAVSLVLLATINIIFEKAYVLQKKVIETKIVEKILFTLARYHAHMEQNNRIAATELTVINRLYPRLCKKPCASIALI